MLLDDGRKTRRAITSRKITLCGRHDLGVNERRFLLVLSESRGIAGRVSGLRARDALRAPKPAGRDACRYA